MKRPLLGPVLILGGMLTAAHADTWVFKDTLRPNGHERSMAAKRADGAECGAERGGRSFSDAAAANMQQCMSGHGWVLARIIPDRPTRHARSSNGTYTPADNSSHDDQGQRQRDTDQQNFNNTQQMINNQQMQNDQQQQQQQQQMINDMNR